MRKIAAIFAIIFMAMALTSTVHAGNRYAMLFGAPKVFDKEAKNAAGIDNLDHAHSVLQGMYDVINKYFDQTIIYYGDSAPRQEFSINCPDEKFYGSKFLEDDTIQRLIDEKITILGEGDFLFIYTHSHAIKNAMLTSNVKVLPNGEFVDLLNIDELNLHIDKTIRDRGAQSLLIAHGCYGVGEMGAGNEEGYIKYNKGSHLGLYTTANGQAKEERFWDAARGIIVPYKPNLLNLHYFVARVKERFPSPNMFEGVNNLPSDFPFIDKSPFVFIRSTDALIDSGLEATVSLYSDKNGNQCIGHVHMGNVVNGETVKSGKVELINDYVRNGRNLHVGIKYGNGIEGDIEAKIKPLVCAAQGKTTLVVDLPEVAKPKHFSVTKPKYILQDVEIKVVYNGGTYDLDAEIPYVEEVKSIEVKPVAWTDDVARAMREYTVTQKYSAVKKNIGVIKNGERINLEPNDLKIESNSIRPNFEGETINYAQKAAGLLGFKICSVAYSNETKKEKGIVLDSKFNKDKCLTLIVNQEVKRPRSFTVTNKEGIFPDVEIGIKYNNTLFSLGDQIDCIAGMNEIEVIPVRWEPSIAKFLTETDVTSKYRNKMRNISNFENYLEIVLSDNDLVVQNHPLPHLIGVESDLAKKVLEMMGFHAEPFEHKTDLSKKEGVVLALERTQDLSVTLTVNENNGGSLRCVEAGNPYIYYLTDLFSGEFERLEGNDEVFSGYTTNTVSISPMQGNVIISCFSPLLQSPYMYILMGPEDEMKSGPFYFQTCCKTNGQFVGTPIKLNSAPTIGGRDETLDYFAVQISPIEVLTFSHREMEWKLISFDGRQGDLVALTIEFTDTSYLACLFSAKGSARLLEKVLNTDAPPKEIHKLHLLKPEHWQTSKDESASDGGVNLIKFGNSLCCLSKGAGIAYLPNNSGCKEEILYHSKGSSDAVLSSDTFFNSKGLAMGFLRLQRVSNGAKTYRYIATVTRFDVEGRISSIPGEIDLTNYFDEAVAVAPENVKIYIKALDKDFRNLSSILIVNHEVTEQKGRVQVQNLKFLYNNRTKSWIVTKTDGYKDEIFDKRIPIKDVRLLTYNSEKEKVLYWEKSNNSNSVEFVRGF
ncbi:hypothetical protein [Desulfatibacillum aliphaticivorans]|uniref:hypothetical protein n=1 Tax=Desulfatibacillum aliphaticivorans TaxID=218208 RepID=UPI0003FEC1A0|nr:hypothetical protein [Desulfatibacillum aliphaticivorans]